MMSQEPPIACLSVQDQRLILNKLELVKRATPLRERFFYSNGMVVSLGTLLACNLVFFRTGFRAFNMYRYNRGRFITVLMSSTFIAQGTLAHGYFSTYDLFKFYRSENIMVYGYRSFVAHQIGFGLCMFVGIGTTYLNARLNGMIPVETDFLRPGADKVQTFKCAMARLKPFRKTLAITWLLSSALMFWTGTREFQESCNLLAKIGRKTLSHKED